MIGVIPEFMKAQEWEYIEADELVAVVTMRERKMLMETWSDAFVALPGGWRTREESMELLTLAHLDALRKPIMIFNQGGCYDELLHSSLFDRQVCEGFMHGTIRHKYTVAHEIEEVFHQLDNWSCGEDEKEWFQTT